MYVHMCINQDVHMLNIKLISNKAVTFTSFSRSVLWTLFWTVAAASLQQLASSNFQMSHFHLR